MNYNLYVQSVPHSKHISSRLHEPLI